MRRRLFLSLLPAGACSTGPAAMDCGREATAVRDLIRKGELAQGLSRVEACLAALEKASDRALADRFRILQSEILISQGRAQAGLDSLAAVEPDRLSDLEKVGYWMHRGYGSAAVRRFDDARRLLAQATELSARTPGRPLAPDIALRVGTLAARTGDMAAAERRFRDALGLAQARDDRFVEAMALGSLGRIFLASRRYDEALDLFARALAINVAIDSKNAMAKDLGNLGLCYSRLGRYDLAETSYRRALDLHTAAENPIDRQRWLGDIGNLRYWSGDLDEAGEYYRQALDTARLVAAKESELKWLNNLSTVALDGGDIVAAERRNREALQAARQVSDGSEAVAARIMAARIADGRNNPEEAERLFAQCLSLGAEFPDKQVEILRLTGEFYVRQGRLEEAEQRFVAAVDAVERSRRALRRAESKAGYLASVMAPYRSYVDLLMSSGRARRAFEVADSSRALALTDALESGSVEQPSGLVERYRGETTLLYYWLAPQASYLWAVGGGKVRSYRLPPEAEIASLVRSYQDRLTVRLRDPIATGDAAGRELFDLLIAPAADALANVSKVVLAPDGVLNTLNFESLVTPGSRYWIEDVELRLTPAAGLTARGPTASRTGRSGSGGPLLLMGDPEPAGDYPRLPSAAAEMRAVRESWRAQATVELRGSAATAAAYLGARPERFDLIHFAAHAEANEQSPLDSAVILSTNMGGYKLYARDVLAARLQAELVTLSACRGAGSALFTGEGLMGFVWAFLSVGARNVVAGLWNVSDRSTAQLMQGLYTRLAQGDEPAAALRAAKLDLIRSEGNYRKPYYWAPFQLYSVS